MSFMSFNSLNISNISNYRSDFRASLFPIWLGNTVYCETGMFVGKDDRLPLLFSPEKILSVTSYGGDVLYEDGKDFILCPDGTISITNTSRIPYISESDYYHNVKPESTALVTRHNGEDVYTYWGDDTTMTRYQICVTYTHSGASDAFVPPCYKERFSDLLSKLEAGKDVTILFFGDSITYGRTSSFLTGEAPFLPSWSVLVTEELARRYGYSVKYVHSGLDREVKVPNDVSFGERGVITYVNTAVGGWKTDHALNFFDERVKTPIELYGCDLFVLAFGMNDGSKTADEFCVKLKAVIDQTLDVKNDISLLLVSTMLPNPDSTNGWYKNQHTYEADMIPLVDSYFEKGVPSAVAPVTSMSKFVCSRKRFFDHSGNNINHPNDFMIRMYAQTVIQTIIGID